MVEKREGILAILAGAHTHYLKQDENRIRRYGVGRLVMRGGVSRTTRLGVQLAALKGLLEDQAEGVDRILLPHLPTVKFIKKLFVDGKLTDEAAANILSNLQMFQKEIIAFAFSRGIKVGRVTSYKGENKRLYLERMIDIYEEQVKGIEQAA